MKNANDKLLSKRKAELQIRFSEFELPPMQDILVIGKLAPIGPEAVKRMVDALAPGQYELITLEDSPIEALAVKTTLFKWVSKKTLLNNVLDEALKINVEKLILKIKVDITILVNKEINI